MKVTIRFFALTLFLTGHLSHGVEVEQKIKTEEAKSAASEAAAVVYPASNLELDTYIPGEGWNLAWSDEFDGDTLNDANWNRQIVQAGRFNEEWQAYTDSEDNAWVEEGCLVIRAIHTGTEHGHDQYTSARLNTAQKQAWTYGKVAARMQLPYGEGIWPAFWMLGANCNENGGDTPWPQCGEIDIMEMYGSKVMPRSKPTSIQPMPMESTSKWGRSPSIWNRVIFPNVFTYLKSSGMNSGLYGRWMARSMRARKLHRMTTANSISRISYC
jgi:beta-glucanase (GH16 family)